jgi:hypothetical protein
MIRKPLSYLQLTMTIGLCLVLSACPKPIVLKTVVLQPDSVTSGYQTNFAQSWECSVPLPGQGGFLNGLGPEPSNPGEAPSGFTDIFNQGAQPFPCNEQEQILYRGHIHFDLSAFDDPVDATLTINQVRSIQNGQNQMQCVATVLGMSTGTREDGQGPYYWDYDNDVSMTPMNTCETIIAPLISIDVSNQVRQWTMQTHFNWGFIIAGPNLGPPTVPSDNNENVTFYGGGGSTQLVVLYNPDLNPRAPQ